MVVVWRNLPAERVGEVPKGGEIGERVLMLRLLLGGLPGHWSRDWVSGLLVRKDGCIRCRAR